jgi:hypothetical protein
LSGLFAAWLVEVGYLVIVGFIRIIFDGYLIREILTIIKYFDYYLIPYVEIHSSAPIKRFIESRKSGKKDISRSEVLDFVAMAKLKKK